MRWLPCLALLAVTGCSAVPQILPVPISPNNVEIPKPAPIQAQAVHWQVLTAAQLQALIDNAAKTHDTEFVLFALDTKNFEALTLNLNDMRRYIEEQKAALDLAKSLLQQAKPTTPANQ